jgi:uncharacterized protein (UPF0303 family)
MSIASDIAALIVQEERLRFVHFDEADAWALGNRMREAALARRLPFVIDIRHWGRPLFYSALPGTDADNPEWVRRKTNVVQRYLRSSYRMGRELLLKCQVLGPDRGVDPAEYAPHGGSFPIHIIGTGIIGAITVSGVPQREDHGFVAEMIATFLGIDYDSLKLGPEEP